MTVNDQGHRRPVPDTLFGGRLRDAYLLDLEVVGIEDLAPHVRRVAVASPDLVGFSYRPGQDLMIEFPGGGSAKRAMRRRYTIRRADLSAGTADLEMELHGGDGIAVAWTATAGVGCRLEAIGPRGNITIRPQADRHLFVADDSAMPAAFAMIEALPAGDEVAAVCVTPHGAGSRPAPTGVGGMLAWVDEEGLADALAGVTASAGAGLAACAAYVNGERMMVKAASDQLLAAGLPADRMATKAYWRRDRPNAEHGEPNRD